MRSRTRRTLATAAVLSLTAALLTGCIDGKVKKRTCSGSGEARVCRLLVVDKNKRERWAEVDQFAYDNCKVGSTYPACGSTGYDNPEGRQEQAKEKRDEQAEKQPGGKQCNRRVQLVANWVPDMFIQIDWFVEDRNGRRHSVHTQHRGAFSHTEAGVCPGGFAGIRADGQANDPDVCNVLVRVNGVTVTNKPPAHRGDHCGVHTAIP